MYWVGSGGPNQAMAGRFKQSAANTNCLSNDLAPPLPGSLYTLTCHPILPSEGPNQAQCALQVVADQIRLWQADSRRVRQTRAVLYDDFASPVLFQKTAAYARQIGVWLWEDGKGSGRLAARADGHEKMREFIRANK
jgi:hypothetical protein